MASALDSAPLRCDDDFHLQKKKCSTSYYVHTLFRELRTIISLLFIIIEYFFAFFFLQYRQLLFYCNNIISYYNTLALIRRRILCSVSGRGPSSGLIKRTLKQK